jgi:hypothetical protein
MYGLGQMTKTHLMSNTPTYRTWNNMLRRCYEPTRDNYKFYGGRGIRVCERWRTFENFLADMGVRPEGTTLDREKNDCDYEPGNCRWATPKEQSNNRRRRTGLKTHCIHGHELPAIGNKLRRCVICHAADSAKRRVAKNNELQKCMGWAR